MTSVAASTSRSTNVPGPCEHKARTGCMLTALPCCCSCADKRPQATAYPVYGKVDGQGMRLKGRRWQRYCRKCYDFWQSLATNTEVSAPSDTPTTTVPPATSPSTAEMPSGRRTMRSSERSYVSEFDFSDNVILNPLYTNPTQPALPLQAASRNPQGRRQGNATDHGHPGDIGQREQVFALGTREDVQQEEYVSPIFGMFNRAWTRYRDAEEERRLGAARQLVAMQHADDLDDDAYQWTDHDDIDVQAISFRTVQQENMPPTDEQRHAVTRQRLLDASPLTMDTMLREGQAQMDRNVAQAIVANGVQQTIFLRRASTDSNVASSRRDPPLQDVANVNPLVFEQTLTGQPMPRAARRARHNFHGQFYSNPFDEQRPLRYHNDGRVIDLTGEGPPDRINPIDAQRPRRPAPAKSEDLKVNFACKICQEQKIDTIFLPCMHAATCRWCNELWRDDCRDINGRVDRRDWKCVICRKQIKETKRFFI